MKINTEAAIGYALAAAKELWPLAAPEWFKRFEIAMVEKMEEITDGEAEFIYYSNGSLGEGREDDGNNQRIYKRKTI